MIKLNLGCGNNKIKGYINCDLVKSVKPDLRINLNVFPYPFPDNYADYILLDNVLEHLDDINLVMKEIYRILKPEGIVEIYVPYAKSDGAYDDPTHKHYFTEKSMDYYEKKSVYRYYTDIGFVVLKKELRNMNKTRLSKLRWLIPFKGILRYIFFNMYDQVYFRLRKR